MAVKIGNETITKLPFSLKKQVSSDPFAPGKTFVREGPWRDLAFLAVIPDDPEAHLQFNWWMSTRELPAGMSRPKVTVHVLANGKEIAASRGPVVPDTLDWYFYERHEMYMPTLPKNRWLTLADIVNKTARSLWWLRQTDSRLRHSKHRFREASYSGSNKVA